MNLSALIRKSLYLFARVNVILTQKDKKTWIVAIVLGIVLAYLDLLSVAFLAAIIATLVGNEEITANLNFIDDPSEMITVYIIVIILFFISRSFVLRQKELLLYEIGANFSSSLMTSYLKGGFINVAVDGVDTAFNNVYARAVNLTSIFFRPFNDFVAGLSVLLGFIVFSLYSLGLEQLLIMILVLSLLSVVFMVFAKRLNELSKDNREYENIAVELVYDLVSSVNEIFFLKGRMGLYNRYKSAVSDSRRLHAVIQFYNQFPKIWFDFCLMILVISLLGSFGVGDKSVESEVALLVFSIFVVTMRAIPYLILMIKGGVTIVASSKVIIDVLNFLSTEYLDQKEALTISRPTRVTIEKREDLLEFVPSTLKFPSVGLVSISGESGAGKTTLLRALAGIGVQDGVTIERDKIKKNEEVYNSITFIPQTPFLMNGTVEENLFGKKISDAFMFIENQIWMKFLNYDSKNVLRKVKIGQKNRVLSGGEMKRFALMRSHLEHSSTILVDEPTSGLDSENEELVIQYLKFLSQTKLVICVTHSKGLVDLADAGIEIKRIKKLL